MNGEPTGILPQAAARGRSLSLLVVAVALLLTAGCATTTRAGGDRGDDVEELKRRVLELQRQARMSELEISRLQEKVARLEARLGDDGRTATRRPAQPPVQPDGPEAEAQDTRVRDSGEREPPTSGHPPLIEEIDLVEEDAEPRSAERDPPPARPAEPAPRPAPTAPTGTPPPPEAQEIYDQAYSLYHRGRYVDAESTFQRFLRGWPATDLADNAQYWIGEARYARGDLRGALAAFRETVERYPQGNKISDALLKAGQTLEALGDVEGARETYREVVRRFGDKPAAVVAREGLEQLP